MKGFHGLGHDAFLAALAGLSPEPHIFDILGSLGYSYTGMIVLLRLQKASDVAHWWTTSYRCFRALGLLTCILRCAAGAGSILSDNIQGPIDVAAADASSLLKEAEGLHWAQRNATLGARQ